MNIIYSYILRLIAGMGIFIYGMFYEEYKIAIPNTFCRFIISVFIWFLFFILIRISEGEIKWKNGLKN